MDKPNVRLVLKNPQLRQFQMWREQIVSSGRKKDTERHREALKSGIIFSAMGNKVFFDPHLELQFFDFISCTACFLL
jgi:hypothetical protein